MKQEKRLKIVMPTLREKERYISFQILSEEGVFYSDLEQAIWSTLLEFYGESGVSKMSVWLVKNLWDGRSQSGVIRCNNKSVDKVLAGLGLVSRLGDNMVILKILRVSGTIRGLELK